MSVRGEARAQGYLFDFTVTGEDWRERSELDALGDAAALRAGAERLVAARVDLCRRHNVSWSRIGDALGISKQAAQQRYGRTDLDT